MRKHYFTFGNAEYFTKNFSIVGSVCGRGEKHA